METRVAAYASKRDALLVRIVAELRRDDRVVAAWLTGSFGRGEEDALSDIDLTCVVGDDAVEALCRRTSMVHAGATPERLGFVGRFGKLMSVHENHFNAPPGATFTNTIYATSGLMVDWMLLPRDGATRPAASRLLFDTVGVPVEPPTTAPSGVELAERLSERVAFFWMMLYPTLKAMSRGDDVRFQTLFDIVARARLDVEALLAGQAPSHHRDSATKLLTSSEARLEAAQAEAACMAALGNDVRAAGGDAPWDPLDTVSAVIELLSQ